MSYLNKLFFVAALSMLFFAACETESVDGGDTTTMKKLKTMTFSNGQTVSFTWDGELLTNIRYDVVEAGSPYSFNFTFTYGDLKPIRMVCDDEEEGFSCDYVWENGLLIKQVMNEDDETTIVNYIYDGGKISKVVVEGEVNYFFSWTGDNVSDIQIKGIGYDYVDSWSLTYDSHTNPIYVPTFGVDMIGSDWFDVFLMPWSVNNITSIRNVWNEDGYEGEETTTYTYTYDSDGYPLTLTSNGSGDDVVVVTYEYE